MISFGVASAVPASASAAVPASASSASLIQCFMRFPLESETATEISPLAPVAKQIRRVLRTSGEERSLERRPAAVVVAEHPQLLECQVVGRRGLDHDPGLEERIVR